MSGIRVAKAIVGIVRFDVTIRGVDGVEIDAGMLTAPLRAGAKDGKLQVEPLDLQAAFAEALDTADRSNQSRRWPVEVQRTTGTVGFRAQVRTATAEEDR